MEVPDEESVIIRSPNGSRDDDQDLEARKEITTSEVVVAENDDDDEYPSPLVLTMMEKLWPYKYTVGQDPSCSIYRVPPNLRETGGGGGGGGIFDPHILSIGPYHHGDPRLAAMEDHKWRYLHNLLVRKSPQSDFTLSLEVCIEKVRRSESQARRCYSEPVLLHSDDFVMMMVLDGCFVLELFLTFYDGREEDDPIHAVAWMLPLIWDDLFKLENQIPFFVLEDLFTVAAGPSVTDLSVMELAFGYLMFRAQSYHLALGMSAEKVSTLSGSRAVYHLLHFYDLALMPTVHGGAADGCNKKGATTTTTINPPRSSFSYLRSILEKMNPFSSSDSGVPSASDGLVLEAGRHEYYGIPTAVKLGEAGIKIRGDPEASVFLDVTFRDGTLKIPPVSVQESSRPVTLNLMAFEQCCPRAGNHLTVYARFLRCVVDTARDVAVLRRCGVIQNSMVGEEAVARVLDQFGRAVRIGGREHYLADLFAEVNAHCRSKWRQRRAVLVRDYFGSPWSVVVVAAVAALLVMTLVQSVYAVLFYHSYMAKS